MALAELVVSIIGDTAKLKQAFADVDKQVAGMGKSFQAAGKQMASAGKSLSLSVTAPVVGLGALSLHTAVQFDDAMRQVQAVSGATGEEFNTLRELAKQLGSETRYSASEAANGMNYLAMAGFEVNDIVKTMPGLLDLAAASNTDLATAADITSNILTGFNMEASETGHLADVLAKAAASANTDVAQLGEAMSYAAPVAASFNVSVEEATAAVGMFSNAGIQASMAGTTLRGILSRLATPTDQAAAVLEKYGLTVQDVNPATHSLTEIVTTLEKVGLSSADAMEIFGDRAGPGMLALISQGSGGLTDLTQQLQNADGAAAKMAETMEGGAGGALRELKSLTESLMIEFGDIVADVILPLVKGLKGLVRYFSDLPTPIKRIIVVVAGLAAAVGPVLIVVGTLISSIGSIMGLLGGAGLTATLGGLAATIAPVIAVVAALAAVGYLVYQNWDKIYPVIQPVVEQLKGFIAQIADRLTQWWATNGETVINGLQQLAEVMGWILSGMISIAASGFEKVFPVIATVIMETLDIILATVSLFLSILTGDWDTAWASLSEIVNSHLTIIVTIISSMISPLQSTFTSLWSGLTGIVTKAWSGITGALNSIFNGIVRSINSLASQMYRAGQNVMSNLVSGIRSKISSAVSAVRSAASQIRNYFPFSPAKEGPLKKLPNWDAFFADPILESTKDIDKVVAGRMEKIAGTIPKIQANQDISVSGLADSTRYPDQQNSSSQTNVGGDTFIIQNMTLSRDYPFEQFMKDMARHNAQKRVQRGL